MPELLPDTKVSHYRIVSKIGEGGMGEVYLAEDTRLERRVAIKFLSEEFSRDEERLRRFTQEAKAVSALNHPNILTIHEIGESEGRRFIASEFINGETLREKIAGQTFDLHKTLEIAIQIASALQAAHASHIVHRDIKPDNVMLREDGLVKVLDFGLAKLTEQKTPGTEEPTRQHVKTRTGTILGTPSYMSPEQTRGKSVDVRSDIWSLGVVLYEMLTKRRPFDGESDGDIIATILRTEPVPPSRYNAAVPAEFDRIIKKTLKKKSEERYQNANDLLIDLKGLKRDLEFAAELERTASTNKNDAAESRFDNAVTADTPPRPATAASLSGETGNRKTAIAAVIAVFLFAALAVGYWYFNSQATKQINSIAVMPFVNDSGNADVEYLSDGMTETLINSLSQLPNFNVKARSSVFRYKGKDTDAQTIGKELNVQAILNGRVVQRIDGLTLYLELVDAKTGNRVWGDQYNRKQTDLISLQNEIARDVAENLKVKLHLRLSGADEQKLGKNYTENVEAYQAYLRGRHIWNKGFAPQGFEKSRDYFQHAIEIDPTYALAYTGLADYYGFSVTFGLLPPDETWPKCEAAVNKALELDDGLAEAYNPLAAVKLYYYGDWPAAERAFRRGIELNPNFAEIRNHYAARLMAFGRKEEALAEAQRALDLEPFSFRFNFNLARILYNYRDYDRSLDQIRKTLDLEANAAIYELQGNVYEQKKMHKEAVEAWSKAFTMRGEPATAAIFERVYTASGFDAGVRAVAEKQLELLDARSKRGDYVPPVRYMTAYIYLGDKEQALSWFAKVVDERSGFKYEANTNPLYDPLRDDSRFKDLLRKVGLPE